MTITRPSVMPDEERERILTHSRFKSEPEKKMDPDYAKELRGDRHDDGDKILRDLRDSILMLRRPVYRNGDHGSSATKWVLGVGAVLLGAFVIGGWNLSNQVSSMQATMQATFTSFERRLEWLEQQQNARQHGP